MCPKIAHQPQVQNEINFNSSVNRSPKSITLNMKTIASIYFFLHLYVDTNVLNCYLREICIFLKLLLIYIHTYTTTI